MTKNKAFPILQGKQGLLLGDANDVSLAHASANLTKELNAGVITTYSNDKVRLYVDPMLNPFNILVLNCHVENEGELEAVIETAAQALSHLDFLVLSIPQLMIKLSFDKQTCWRDSSNTFLTPLVEASVLKLVRLSHLR